MKTPFDAEFDDRLFDRSAIDLPHDLYHDQLPADELASVAPFRQVGLAEEIALLRACLRRVVARQHDHAGFTQALQVLAALSFALSSLSRLMRIQYRLAEMGPTSTERTLKEFPNYTRAPRSAPTEPPPADEGPLTEPAHRARRGVSMGAEG